MSEDLLTKIKATSRVARDEVTKEKLRLFAYALELGKVNRACQELGRSTRYYYLWWNRYREGGFKAAALQERSRRPKRHPRQVEVKIVQLIKRYRESQHFTIGEIRLALLKDHQVRISLATIHRVLIREKVSVRKRRSPTAKREGKEFHKYRDLRPSILPLPTTESINAGIPFSTHTPRLIAGRYLTERLLGSGGGGIVYLAQDQKIRGPRVALKVAERSAGMHAAPSTALKNEFRFLASLKHRNLAKVFDFGLTEKELFFTSEWIEGTDILSATHQSNLNTVFHLIVQVLRALDFLRRKGVLHLDLKPNNILITDPNRTGELTVKLIDFGSAEWKKKGMVGTGEFAGTIPYASPEIILGKPPTPASDIYSLGILLHQIFAGRFPFQDQDPIAMMKQQIYGEALRIEVLNPALPASFIDILFKMVATKPEDRFQSPGEVLEAINQCLGENYLLRGDSAPDHILEASDHIFRKNLVQELIEITTGKIPQVIILSGPAESGKSQLVQQIKEGLQLRGIHPLFFRQASVLEEFFQEGPPPLSNPLLVDAAFATPRELVVHLDDLENARVPVIVTVPFSPIPELNPNRWIELKALSQDQILQFLNEEIADFPTDTFGPELFDLSNGLPGTLDQILQALHEEGMIQWGDVGWRYTGAERISPKELLPRQAARWDQHMARVREILEHSQVGMTARSLEGMMGMDPGSLEDKLEEWVKNKFLIGKPLKGIPHFFSKNLKSSAPQTFSIHDWPWLEAEMEGLYQSGSFDAGVQWAELVEAQVKVHGPSPEKITLLAARHYVAAGLSEKAIQALLPQPPRNENDAGLFHEIRGRAFSSLGNLDQARTELDKGRAAYGAAGDILGLSRVTNLRGTLEKRSSNFESAQHFFLEAIQFGAKGGNVYQEGMAQMNLGILFQEQGQVDRAYAAYEKGFELEKKSEQPLLSCKLRENWLHLLFLLGRNEEAQRAAFDLLKTSLKFRYVEQQAAAFNYLGLLAGQKNQFAVKLNYLNQALGILSPLQFPQLTFQSLMNRAYHYLDLDKFTAAQLDVELALQIGERNKNNLFIAWAHLILGKVYRDRPRADLEAAMIHFNKAHKILFKMQNRRLLWEVEFDRGLLAKKKGESERAKNYFLSSQKYIESLLGEMPKAFKSSFLRDRKLERVLDELKSS